MAKYDVTSELAETIRSVRIQNHVSAKALAGHIGKSQSYISKLEKGDIKSIQENELTRILQFIFNDEMGVQDFLDSTLEKLLDTLELRYSDKEIEDQLWFYNYDTVSRSIPIPEELVDDINTRMASLQLSCQGLCERINSNEDISPEVQNTDQYPFNEWQAFVVDHKVLFQFIKMRVSNIKIESILAKECKSCNYITILSLVYYLLKIERNLCLIGENEKSNLMREARLYLNSFKFFSLTEKNRLRQQAKTQSDLDNLVSSFDQKNAELIQEIIISFSVFSDIDISKTNKYLEAFVKNLRWDNGLLLTLLGQPFYDLKNMGFTAKKHMLSDIQMTIEKYKNLPDAQKQMEIYD